jgi:hypothetical protein
MVVDAVCGEPVSAQIRWKQGNNREFLRNLHSPGPVIRKKDL